MRARILLVSLAVIFTAAALASAHELHSVDLEATHDLASLEFNDPGSVDALLQSKHTQDAKLKAEFSVDRELDYLQHKHSSLKKYEHALLQTDAHEETQDAEIERFVEAAAEGEPLPKTSLISSKETTQGRLAKNPTQGPPKAYVAPLPTRMAKLPADAKLQDYFNVARSEIGKLRENGLPVTPYADTIMKQVQMLNLNKERLLSDIKNNRVIPAAEVDKMESRRALRGVMRRSRPRRRNFEGRANMDVIDCTACRYAWLKVEQDLGNSRVYHQLYDVFVQHCSLMQESQIFFHSCNKMFGKIDKMIADYVIGHTVNQMCMKAGMCR